MPLADLRERPAPPFPWLRILLMTVLVVGGLIGGAVGVIRALIDTEAMKADAEAALRQATGRAVRIAGPITIQSYFGGIVAVDDVQIPNRPGAAQPLMARIGRLEAEISLWSLFGRAIEVQRLVVVQPDILVEIDAEGSGNWRADPASPQAAPLGGTFRTWPRNLHLKDGRLTVADARTGSTTVVALRRISASEVDVSGQLGFAADLAIGSQRVAVAGQIGTLARLFDRSGESLWPVRLTLETQGARLAAAGTFRHPLDLAGYALKVDASMADSSAVAAFVPFRLPTLRTVVASARISDTDGPWPEIAAGRLQMGASDLGIWVPGLKVEAMELNLPGLDQSLRGEFLGTLNGVPVRVQGALGGIAAFLPGAVARPDPFPIDISAEMGESRLSLKGSIGAPAARRGLDLAMALRIRDLELLSPVVGQRLPAVRNLMFDAKLGDGEGGFMRGLKLSGASLAAPQGDLAGELILHYGGRPSLQGRLKGDRLDADGLYQAVAAVLGPLSVFQAEIGFRPGARRATRVISDSKLDLAVLDRADIDLVLDVGEFRVLATNFRDLNARLHVVDGALSIDPMTAELPLGRASLRFTAEGRDPRHAVTLRTTIPGIPVQPLLAGPTRRDNLFGMLELDADLQAEGETLRALAATVSGHAAAVIVEGDLDARMLLDPLADVMAAARVPVNLGTQIGALSRLRCFAGRVEAEAGLAKLATLALDGWRVQLVGEGTFNLRDETWALRLRPALRGTALTATVPLRLGGSFMTPRLQLDMPEPPPRPAGGVPRALEPRAELSQAELPDICTAALASARGGRAGTMPADREARPGMVRPGPQRPQR